MKEPRVFEIRPHDGAGPVLFGMRSSEVHTKLGPPLRRMRNHLGEWEELWNSIKIGYDTDKAVEIQLMPPAEAVLDGNDLLRSNDPVRLLLPYDPEPLESVGIILFLKVGIGVTGFGDSGDDSDKAVGVFASGRWEGALSRFRPLRVE